MNVASANEVERTRRPLRDRLMLLLARGHANRALRAFMRCVHDATRTQERVLLEKLQRNRVSDFGGEYGFDRIRTYQDFVQRIPILGYEQLAPYIERVMRGEVSAMFRRGETILMFAKTSGTTDKPKYIPVTSHFLNEYRAGWNAFGVKAIHDHAGCFLRPIVQVSSPMDEEHAPSGIPCGAITGLMAATQQRLVKRYYVVPDAVAYIPDAVSRYYAVARFAAPHDVAFLITASPATQLRLARALDTHAERLIRDVHDGTLSVDEPLPLEIRAALQPHLRPDADAARCLQAIVERTGRLLPRDVWRLGFLANWTGGTMGLHLREFPDYFGGTPVRDVGLIASEGRMSIPLEDGSSSGVLNVRDNFYEFIPASEYGEDHPTVLRSHELVVGEEYFILLTTSAGFYRYDIGDRVRVTGYLGQAPLIEFLHKGVHASSMTGEKLTEQQAVMAFAELDAAPDAARHFVLAPRWGDPPFYCLHVDEDDLTHAASDETARAYDQRLQAINVEYASKRASGRLGPVRVQRVPNDWLERRDREISAQQRAANEQFKHCYLLSKVDADADFPVAIPASA